VTPYYQDDHVTIYHGDCRDVLPRLERGDVLLTDPPYSQATHDNVRTWNDTAQATTLFEGNALPPNVWHTADNRLFVEHLTKNVSQIDVKDALSVERLLTTTRARMQEFAVPERSLILSSLTGERR
jgi:23S rRNA A2030 N6-methylase RlmJ